MYTNYYVTMSNKVQIVLPHYPIFVQVGFSRRTKMPKYEKINFQNIYNRKWSGPTRAIIIQEMKDFVIECMEEAERKDHQLASRIETLKKPIHLSIIMYGSEKQGALRYKGGKWIVPKKYGRFDAKNVLDMWAKVIPDCIVQQGYLPDDDVMNLCSILCQYRFIENDKQRRIVIELKDKPY